MRKALPARCNLLFAHFSFQQPKTFRHIFTFSILESRFIAYVRPEAAPGAGLRRHVTRVMVLPNPEKGQKLGLGLTIGEREPRKIDKNGGLQ